jgi:hypothetical protein
MDTHTRAHLPISFSFQLTPHPLDVLDEVVLAAQLAPVAVVVHPLPILEVHGVKHLVHPLAVRPMDVPVELRVGLLPPT